MARTGIGNSPAAVLGCSGSPRRGGNSDLLLRAALRGAEETGADGFAAHLPEYAIGPCIGCERCRTTGACTRLLDGMQLLYPRVEAARGLILACPAHHYNITAWMKAFIDRLYCYYDFDMQTRPRSWSSRLAGQGRAAVLLAVCEQPAPEDMGLTLEAMRLPLRALGYDILGELPVLGVFDKGKVADADLAQAAELGRELGRYLHRQLDRQLDRDQAERP